MKFRTYCTVKTLPREEMGSSEAWETVSQKSSFEKESLTAFQRSHLLPWSDHGAFTLLRVDGRHRTGPQVHDPLFRKEVLLSQSEFFYMWKRVNSCIMKTVWLKWEVCFEMGRMLICTLRDITLWVGKNTAAMHANKSIAKSIFLALTSHSSYQACYIMQTCYCNFLLFSVTWHE